MSYILFQLFGLIGMNNALLHLFPPQEIITEPARLNSMHKNYI